MRLQCVRKSDGLTVGKWYDIHEVKGAGTIYGYSFIVKNDDGFYIEYPLFDFIEPGKEGSLEIR